MKNIFLLFTIIVFAVLACNTKKAPVETVSPAPPLIETVDPADAPPKTWKEHWFEHVQLLNRIYYDTSVVVYYDGDVKPTVTWPKTYMAEAWNYTKKVYGKFGDDSRLFVIYHAGKYGGGHPGTYLDAGHDYRNVTDCGANDLNAWVTGVDNDIDLSTHEIGHIVEGASKGVKESPAFDIWHDSKWMEIYQYDVYLGLNRPADAQRWLNKMMTTTDNYPRAGTQWFKNWFLPIYENYGKTKVLNGFFTLLSLYFPKQAITVQGKNYQQYTRKMNFGEFIHFWSGAAKADLAPLALAAFGSKDEKGADWAPMLAKAKTDFPNINY
ncbi:hypothetical protein [Pedobacter sp.]|uniref:hypothetical protein n=1 Tax=Pedobacter sp. TaxID=1411316 RepID=UPI0031DA8A6A